MAVSASGVLSTPAVFLVPCKKLFTTINPHISRVSLISSTVAKNRTIKCQAASGEGGNNSTKTTTATTVYQGVYGPWSVEPSDVQEVILYRSGLVTAAASFVLAASSAFLTSHSSPTDFIRQNIDIKRTLQALWVLGVFGSLATKLLLAQPADESLVQYIIDNPIAVWSIGPLFAALTGLVFKEGLCYGKLEAGILTFVIPSVLLGHLSGLMDNGVKIALLGMWMALFVIFAGRKFTQPIKDDIGDKSVFMFNALPDEEKAVLVQKLEQQ